MLKDYNMTPNRAGIPVWRPAQPVIGREDEHQTALTNWARMMRTQYPALTLYHHIPNGGLRDKRTAARLTGQGVHSGVPDVFIPAARGGYHGIYVELKTGANNPTPNQNEFMSGAMAEGYYCAVCYGWPCAAAVIEDYLSMPAALRRIDALALDGKHNEGCAWCKAEYTIIDDEFAQPISQKMIKFCWHCGSKLEGNNESTV